MKPKNIPEPIILPHGGYRKLLSYKKACLIYDGTYRFCERFLKKSDRTCDQMLQAARSGKQNIVEGSQASGTSKETELKLTNVARASLEELKEDYLDYLRRDSLTLWQPDSKEALYVRNLDKQANDPPRLLSEVFETRPAEVVANVILCLIHQADYCLDRQLAFLEKDFIEHGGIRERMTAARLAERNRNHE